MYIAIYVQKDSSYSINKLHLQSYMYMKCILLKTFSKVILAACEFMCIYLGLGHKMHGRVYEENEVITCHFSFLLNTIKHVMT